jgi:hypothetical protein
MPGRPCRRNSSTLTLKATQPQTRLVDAIEKALPKAVVVTVKLVGVLPCSKE